MPSLIPSRRLIALLAAYVVALQALLLPLTIAAHPILDGSLCASATADGGPPPAGHDSGCPAPAARSRHRRIHRCYVFRRVSPAKILHIRAATKVEAL